MPLPHVPTPNHHLHDHNWIELRKKSLWTIVRGRRESEAIFAVVVFIVSCQGCSLRAPSEIRLNNLIKMQSEIATERVLLGPRAFYQRQWIIPSWDRNRAITFISTKVKTKIPTGSSTRLTTDTSFGVINPQCGNQRCNYGFLIRLLRLRAITEQFFCGSGCSDCYRQIRRRKWRTFAVTDALLFMERRANGRA